MKFVKRNTSRNSEGSEKTISYNNSSGSSFTSGSTSLESHNIWGQPFDGTSDVTGDMQNVGKITATGDIQTDGKLIIKQVDEEGNQIEDGDLSIAVNDNKAEFSGKENYVFDNILTADKDLIVNQDAYISGNTWVNGNLYGNNATLNDIAVNNISSSDIINQGTITTQNLEVTGSAHFFQLMIDKVKAAGGAVLFTPANGFYIDMVEAVTDGYKLYWQANVDGQNQIDNMWKINDQALCMSFNQKTDTTYNISNKYYWSLVTDVSSQPITMDGRNYHYITISTITKDGTVNPEEGDAIAMLGYRGTDDSNRQSAIYISAYTSLDKGLKAPLLAQYKGINDFNLESHRQSYFDAVGAKFVGNFEVSGQSIEDYINSQIDGAESGTPYIGTNGNWYVWDSETKKYKDSGIKAKGQDGTNGKDGKDGINGKDGQDGINGINGTNGTDGKDGKGIKSIITKYYTWSSNAGLEASRIWNYGTTTMPTDFNDSFPWLWSMTRTTYTDDTYTDSNAFCIGYKAKNGKDGDKGTDAIIYKLEPTQESALVDANSKLTIKLGYIVYQQVGDNKTQIVSSSYTVRYIANTESTYHQISQSGSVYSLTNAANYSQEDYLTVELLKDGSVYDTRIVPVRFAATASLTINQNLGQISTRVTNNEKSTSANTNNISSLTQKANSMESTISSHTTSINQINGKVSSNQTDIASLKQTASSLTSTISSTKGEIIGDNILGGQNGVGWSGSFVYDEAGCSFTLNSSTEWGQSPPIEDYSGDYLFSFGMWGGNADIAIYEFDQYFKSDASFNIECDFKGYDVCTIYKSTLNASTADITNTYGVSGKNNTYSINGSLANVQVGDTVAVQIFNTTTAKNNYIYGKVVTVATNASLNSMFVTTTDVLYPARLITQFSTTTVYDGTEVGKLHKAEEFDRYWIRFKETQGSTKTFVIRMKNVNSTASSISRLMMEESVEYPHKYSNAISVTQSMIKQSAEEIKLQVNDTYLKIGDGNITLNGDTQVNGALTLTNSDQGFILSGGKGVTEIMPKSIGDYQTFQQKSSRTIKTSGNYQAIGGGGSFGSSSTLHITYNWTVRQSLGKLSKGSYIQLTEYGATVRKTNSGTVLGYPDAIFIFYEDGVLKSTLDTVKTSSKNPLGSYTTSAEADITVVGVFSYSTTSSDIGWTGNGMIPTATLGVGWTNILPTSAYMLIGYDGIAINFGSNKSAFISSEAAIFNYGDYQLKLSDKGISKQNRRNVYVVRGNGTTSAPITYTVEDPIDTVLCVATNSKVIFPSNPYDGQEIKIFDKSKDNCYVNSSGKYVVSCTVFGTGSVWTNTELPGRVPRLYTYMNGKWYEEYTG